MIRGGDNHSRLAEATLQGAAGIEATLYRGGLVSVAEPFDGLDLFALMLEGEGATGECGLAVDKNCASPTVTFVAALL